MGRVWHLDKEHGSDTKLHLKKEVHECLDQLMVFGLPSRSHADVLVIPVEYAMLPSVDFEDVDSLALVGLMRNYPVDFIDRIANYYNVNTKLPQNPPHIFSSRASIPVYRDFSLQHCRCFASHSNFSYEGLSHQAHMPCQHYHNIYPWCKK